MSVREEAPLSAPDVPFAGSMGKVRDRLADYAQLAKLRLSSMVVTTGVVGYWLGSTDILLSHLLWFTAGTLMIVAGANAFNQVIERRSDARMARTAERPLPAGRVSVGEARAVASVLSVAGLSLLFVSSGALTAGLGLLALITYAWVYTPLKSRSSWSTVPGAIAGAIPPLMGWTAVQSEITPFAWCLFGIVFFWQFPHTWAIAATYREDYEKAGYRAAPLRGTRLRTLTLTLALVAVSVVPAALGNTGTVYLVGACALGALVLGAAFRFGDGVLRPQAVQLLVVSLFYLPLLLALLAIDGKLV